MAEIVGFVSFSHSPFWDRSFNVSGPGADFVRGVSAMRDWVEKLAPDTVVIFGPDHFKNFFYDVLPPFCIGIGDVWSIGDFGCPKGQFPLASNFARDIYAHVTQAGFDPAHSYNMGIDHGLVQPYAVLMPGLDVPIVPIMVGVNGTPRPSFRRCYQFGRAAGEAIRATPDNRRVLLLGSGGVSHWVPSMDVDDPAVTGERRDYLINGKARAAEYSAARDASVLARKDSIQGKVNEDFDSWFLSQISSGDLEPIFAAPQSQIEAEGGNGAFELGTWIAALGAWNGPVRTVVYEPVPRWAAGMGCIASQA
jgi:2,3-dihydroxyphenylpropionate 1,2-dioxygenase